MWNEQEVETGRGAHQRQQSRAPNVDAFVQEKRADRPGRRPKRLRDEAAAERRFRESAERRGAREGAFERQVSQAKKMLARDEEKQFMARLYMISSE